MVRWLRWHCPPDTGLEIRALAVWGRVRYLSVTEAPHNTDFHTWMGKKHFRFFQTAETGNRTPNSGVKGSGANHYPRAPDNTLLWHITLHYLSSTDADYLLFGAVTSTLPSQVRPSDYQSDLDNRCVCDAGTKRRGCEQHEYSLWRHRFTDCCVEVTLRSDCLACRSWAGKRGVLNS